MKNFKHTFLVFILSLFTFSLIGQTAAVGQWRDHLPYSSFIAITETPDKVFGATPYAVLTYNKTDESIERYTKINGLSDIEISDIRYSSDLNTVVLAYRNTNIDLFKDNYIINIPDIKRKPILGNKVINKISFHSDFAYLSCGFGIVVLDVVKEEIADTWYIGPNGSQINVFDFTNNDTSFFAATEEGIFYASMDHPNLADFSAWSRMYDAPYAYKEYFLIENFAGNIFGVLREGGAISSDSIVYFNGTEWNYIEKGSYGDVTNMHANNGKLVISMDWGAKLINENIELDYIIWTYNPGSVALNDAVNAMTSGDVWLADKYRGMAKSWAGGWESMIINPGGPASASVFSMTAAQNNVWVAPGGYTNTWNPRYINQGAFRFANEEWTNFNGGNTAALMSVRDIVSIAANPANINETYLGAFRNEVGLVEMMGNEAVESYTTENSELQKWEAAGTIATVGTGFDSKGSLWVLCSGAEKLLAEKKSDDSWASYSLGGSASSVDCSILFVDSYDQKWVIFRHTNSNPNYMAVYDETMPPNQGTRLLRGETGVGNIPGTQVFGIAQDLDGEVWIGTDEGIAIFYSPSTIMTSSDYDAVRPLVNFDGYVQYLLETEVVTTIAVDGDNRKWIGTDRSGVFLLSPDGTEQIYHFTEDNSPLFSNQVIDIVINADGEVFMGTANGIIAYKGTASSPSESYSDVYAYPNPVKDGYDGWIAVKGLMQDSDIKITDINGNLIYSTRSEGGQAVWNGKNFDGKKARPGVYLVFASTSDGSETVVTKILIID